MKNCARFALAVGGLVLGFAAMTRSADEKSGIEAKAAFERIKTLAGEWKVVDPTEHHGKDGKIIYKVTSAGSAVMSSEFPGTNHEMVTIYFLDGDDLKATHYCALGNQPRVKLDRKASTPDVLSFVFDGGTNFDPAKDMHIHAFRVKFLEGGKVESEWDSFVGGEKADSVKISLVRP